MTAVKPAQRRMLQALIGAGHADAVTVDAISRIYKLRCRPISPGSSADYGMTGAALRMLRILERGGFVADGRVTRAGRRAAQLSTRVVARSVPREGLPRRSKRELHSDLFSGVYVRVGFPRELDPTQPDV